MQSEKPTAGLLSGSHFHIAGVAWGLDMHTEVDVPCTIKRKKGRMEGEKKESSNQLNKIMLCSEKMCFSSRNIPNTVDVIKKSQEKYSFSKEK